MLDTGGQPGVAERGRRVKTRGTAHEHDVVIDRLGCALQLDPHSRPGSFLGTLYSLVYCLHTRVDVPLISMVHYKGTLRLDYSPRQRGRRWHGGSETLMLLHTGQPLPQQMVETVRRWDRRHSTPGWLDEVPTTIADLCTKWTIELDHVVPDTYVTLVALGHSDVLGPVVVKSSALADEFLAEATALNLGAGENVARVYDLDVERSAMVIERIVPGTQLRDAALSDDDATRLAAETVATFWRPAPDPGNLHPLRRWMRALFEWSPRPDLIAPDVIQHAQDLAAALLLVRRRTACCTAIFSTTISFSALLGNGSLSTLRGSTAIPASNSPPGCTTRKA
jgi:aminoglycoside/hydroxyurea antibiotic resistance kinase